MSNLSEYKQSLDSLRFTPEQTAQLAASAANRPALKLASKKS
jgi:hypothetical protein